MPDSLQSETFSIGFAALAWIEWLLRHGPGDIIGEAIELDDEFARFIVDAYEIQAPDEESPGKRIIRRAVLSRPKGRAKSELAGMFVCFEAIGPARFDRWAEGGETTEWGYEYAENEPIGRPVTSPFIRCLATEETQTGNTYDNVRVMLDTDEVRECCPGLDIGLTRVFLPDGGEIRPSTASGAAKDGGKETFAVADETHLAILDDLRDMHAVVSRNLRKRRIAEPWMLETTTAYRPGMDSIAERAASYATKLGSRAAQRAAGLLYDHVEGPPVDNVRDPEQMIPAMRATYGVASNWMDLGSIAADLADPANEVSDARRFWLNQVTAGASAWLTSGELDGMFPDVIEPLEDGTPIALGFDGSRYHDATALVAVTADWRSYLLNVWEHDGSVDWEVPEAEVDAAVTEAHELYIPVLGYADPPFWETNVASWAERWPKVWKRWPTSSMRRMADAVGAASTSIRAGQVLCGAHPTFRTHLQQAQRRPILGRQQINTDREAFVLQKDRKGSSRKVDAAVAFVLGHEAARDAHTAGLWAKARRPGRRLLALSD